MCNYWSYFVRFWSFLPIYIWLWAFLPTECNFWQLMATDCNFWQPMATFDKCCTCCCCFFSFCRSVPPEFLQSFLSLLLSLSILLPLSLMSLSYPWSLSLRKYNVLLLSLTLLFCVVANIAFTEPSVLLPAMEPFSEGVMLAKKRSSKSNALIMLNWFYVQKGSSKRQTFLPQPNVFFNSQILRNWKRA